MSLSQAEPVHTGAHTHTVQGPCREADLQAEVLWGGGGGGVAAESSVPSGTLALLSCQGLHPLNHLCHLLGHLLGSSHRLSLHPLSRRFILSHPTLSGRASVQRCHLDLLSLSSRLISSSPLIFPGTDPLPSQPPVSCWPGPSV